MQFASRPQLTFLVASLWFTFGAGCFSLDALVAGQRRAANGADGREAPDRLWSLDDLTYPRISRRAVLESVGWRGLRRE